MNLRNFKKIILFTLLLGISMPSHAWWGQETLAGWWNSATSTVSNVASSITSVFSSPSEHRGAIGAAVAGVATLAAGIFAFNWWRNRGEASGDEPDGDDITSGTPFVDEDDDTDDTTSGDDATSTDAEDGDYGGGDLSHDVGVGVGNSSDFDLSSDESDDDPSIRDSRYSGQAHEEDDEDTQAEVQDATAKDQAEFARRLAFRDLEEQERLVREAAERQKIEQRQREAEEQARIEHQQQQAREEEERHRQSALQEYEAERRAQIERGREKRERQEQEFMEAVEAVALTGVGIKEVWGAKSLQEQRDLLSQAKVDKRGVDAGIQTLKVQLEQECKDALRYKIEHQLAPELRSLFDKWNDENKSAAFNIAPGAGIENRFMQIQQKLQQQRERLRLEQAKREKQKKLAQEQRFLQQRVREAQQKQAAAWAKKRQEAERRQKQEDVAREEEFRTLIETDLDERLQNVLNGQEEAFLNNYISQMKQVRVPVRACFESFKKRLLDKYEQQMKISESLSSSSSDQDASGQDLGASSGASSSASSSSRSPSPERYTDDLMQQAVTDRNFRFFAQVSDFNNLPAWEDVEEDYKGMDRVYQINFILGLCGLEDETTKQAVLAEVLPKIEGIADEELLRRAKEFYEQYKAGYAFIKDEFIPVEAGKASALKDAQKLLDSGNAATEWYAFDGYDQGSIKFMMRRFKPVGITDSQGLKKGVLVSIHGTFVDAANFGANLSRKAGVALLEAVQRMATARNMEIDVIIPEWSGAFNETHRQEVAPLVYQLMTAWYKINETRDLEFVDMLGHSEGNSVIKLVIEQITNPNMRKLIRWYSVCPTAGSDYVPEGTNMRLCVWSPSDALAFIASATRGRVYRKQDEDIARHNGLCMNMCLRHNGEYTNHVTSKLPAFAHYDQLVKIAQEFRGHCELSVDINDKYKRISVAIRRGKECRSPMVTDDRNAQLQEISKRNESFFAARYGDKNWHEKPHTMAGFIVHFFKHGFFEKAAGDAEDAIEAESLTDSQIIRLREEVYRAGFGWTALLSLEGLHSFTVHASRSSASSSSAAASSSSSSAALVASPHPTVASMHSSRLVSTLSVDRQQKINAIKHKLAQLEKLNREQQEQALLGLYVRGAIVHNLSDELLGLERCIGRGRLENALRWYRAAKGLLTKKDDKGKGKAFDQTAVLLPKLGDNTESDKLSERVVFESSPGLSAHLSVDTIKQLCQQLGQQQLLLTQK